LPFADAVGEDCPVFYGLYNYTAITAGGSIGIQKKAKEINKLDVEE
jgi:hypothetical protein